MNTAMGIQLFLVVLFARTLWHKLFNYTQFHSELQAYQLIPGFLLHPCHCLLIFLESLCIIGLLFFEAALWLSAALLILYSLVMGYQLSNHKAPIDCGCSGWLSAPKKISRFLVFRNVVLILLIGFCLITPENTPSSIWQSLLIAGTLWLLYETAEQALSNYQQHRQWLSNRGLA